jgi:pimeloyl-ACP methyl ester carboxylesterase
MTHPSTDLLHQLAAARGICVSARPPPQAQMFTASDGACLHYPDLHGAAETMVLLHGGVLCANTFDLFVLALGSEIRSVALDLRGHPTVGIDASVREDSRAPAQERATAALDHSRPQTPRLAA